MHYVPAIKTYNFHFCLLMKDKIKSNMFRPTKCCQRCILQRVPHWLILCGLLLWMWGSSVPQQGSVWQARLFSKAIKDMHNKKNGLIFHCILPAPNERLFNTVYFALLCPVLFLITHGIWFSMLSRWSPLLCTSSYYNLLCGLFFFSPVEFFCSLLHALVSPSTTFPNGRGFECLSLSWHENNLRFSDLPERN